MQCKARAMPLPTQSAISVKFFKLYELFHSLNLNILHMMSYT